MEATDWEAQARINALTGALEEALLENNVLRYNCDTLQQRLDAYESGLKPIDGADEVVKTLIGEKQQLRRILDVKLGQLENANRQLRAEKRAFRALKKSQPIPEIPIAVIAQQPYLQPSLAVYLL